MANKNKTHSKTMNEVSASGAHLAHKRATNHASWCNAVKGAGAEIRMKSEVFGGRKKS